MWAGWGQHSHLDGFFGPWFLQLGYGGKAGLGCFVEALAKLGLSHGLLTQAGARAPAVGASEGVGEVAPSQPVWAL